MEIIYTETGAVKTGRGNVILKAHGIGSCVVIAAYHPGKKVGVMAHIMLPGTAPAGKDIQKTKYAADAVDELIQRMEHYGVIQENIEVYLAGGCNVLEREDDIICENNIRSITGILNEKHIRIKDQSLGGTRRRSISLDVDTGIARYTVGDEEEQRFTEGY